MYKRWYDEDATVCLAVSLMRNANILSQYKCADIIVNKSKENGIDLSENILADAFSYVLRRWYDSDQKIAESFEYFKLLPLEIKKEVALDIIAYLKKAEAE